MEINSDETAEKDNWSYYPASVFIEILRQLPVGCILDGDSIIPTAFKDGQLLKLQNYIFEPADIARQEGSVFVNLTPECIRYLISELEAGPSLIWYFCHYVIYKKEKIFVEVFDSESFTIDSSIKIDPELVEKCKEVETWLSFKDNIIPAFPIG